MINSRILISVVDKRDLGDYVHKSLKIRLQVYKLVFKRHTECWLYLKHNMQEESHTKTKLNINWATVRLLFTFLFNTLQYGHDSTRKVQGFTRILLELEHFSCLVKVAWLDFFSLELKKWRQC